MSTFVPIARFTYQHEFAVLKLLLENEDIEFFFQNETSFGVLPFSSVALIILKVRADQVDEAKEILERFQQRNLSIK